MPIISVNLRENVLVKTLKNFLYPLEHLCVPQEVRNPI